jgi:hypothetical protein
MSKLTYGDFTKTGWQDCGNVLDVDSHYEAWRRLGKLRGEGAAKKVVREAWGDDDLVRESWLDGVDVGELVESSLDPRRAYVAWRDAWLDCATSAIARAIHSWTRREEEDA